MKNQTPATGAQQEQPRPYQAPAIIGSKALDAKLNDFSFGPVAT